MAELQGGLLPGSSHQVGEITVEMLDYAYVNECEDYKKLQAILSTLKSGKEGYYPDVSRFII